MIADEKYNELKLLLADTPVRVSAGPDALCAAAALPGRPIVLNAIVGIGGLLPTLAAVRTGNTVALANKETLVVYGTQVMREARENGVPILPVDSEPFSYLPMPARRGRKPRAPAAADCFRRAVLRQNARRAARRHARAGAGTPELADGAEDHGRFVDDDEQGL